MEEAAASSFSRKKQSEKCIKHYSSSQRILLVGEGDFSFSACLARAFGSAKNMVATSYDDKDKLLQKHWTARNHLGELKRLGCTIFHGINVKDMHQDLFLKAKRFDRIIFNFPHAGHDPELCERDKELILRHRELLRDFFSSARCLLSENGEIHVSHRDDQPYAQWRIRSSANKRGLILKEMVQFEKKDYPGYHNKRGGGIQSNKTFPLGDKSFTFKFSLIEDLGGNEGLSAPARACSLPPAPPPPQPPALSSLATPPISSRAELELVFFRRAELDSSSSSSSCSSQVSSTRAKLELAPGRAQMGSLTPVVYGVDLSMNFSELVICLFLCFFVWFFYFF